MSRSWTRFSYPSSVIGSWELPNRCAGLFRKQLYQSLSRNASSKCGAWIILTFSFSCALFDANGELVANAPNVPAHLGSMQYAVVYQAKRRKGELRPGDLLVSNTPEAGGGHLPDITVGSCIVLTDEKCIQPVFGDDGKTIVFWVAARGHHTDIGGLGGNSHHPNQIDRAEEGVAFESTFVIRDGIFNEKEIVDTFMKAGDWPGCKPTKRIEHNLSDLKAQCSACVLGTTQLGSLFAEYGTEVVHFYMKGRF